jgi:hypothetical protein
MIIQLQLQARDVTALPDERPYPDAGAVPQHRFEIQHRDTGYSLEFNGNRANVPNEHMAQLARTVSETTRVDWQYSRDTEIQNTFRPLNRILQCINSTPSYQLFLAGFHIAETIGMLSLDVVSSETVPDSFTYLVGNLPWPRGKQGRLFVLREGTITDAVVRNELIANGKLFESQLWFDDDNGMHHVGDKLIIPYATPIGFNTQVHPQTEEAWRRICEFVRHHGGGHTQ